MSLIARWSFDNNYREKTGTYTTTLFGGNIRYQTAGVKEGSHYVDFYEDDDEYLSVTPAIDLVSYNEHTIAMWIDSKRVSPSGDRVISFNNVSSPSGSDEYSIYPQAVSATSIKYRYIIRKSSSNYSLDLSSEVFDKGWAHVVFTINSTTAKVYVNGNLSASTPYTKDTTINITDTTIGALRIGSVVVDYLGYIDDLRIYNSELSSADVKNLYESYDRQPLWNYVSRWSLDGDATDSGPAGNDGTATNVTFPTGRKVEGYNSAEFDGYTSGGYIKTNTYANLFQYTDFTISCWFKAIVDTHGMLYCEADTADTRTFLSFSNAPFNNYLRVFTRKGDSTLLLNSSGAIVAYDGDWHHAVYTDANGTVKLYVDGVEDTAFATSYTRSALGGNNSIIGAVNNSNGFTTTLNGNIDDFRIYGYALSAAQARQLYNSYHGQYGLVQSAVA